MNVRRIGMPVILLSLGACSQDAPVAGSVETDFLGPGEVATVDGHRIAESLLDVLAEATLQKPASELTDDERALLVEQLISMRLLANAAMEGRLPETQKIAAELEYRRAELLARAMIDRFRAENPPSEAELRQAYEENLPRFLTTQYKARHILVDTETEAQELISELDAGADFAELARQHSTGPTAPDGGDLGWFSADSMVAPFAEAVQRAQVGVHFPTPVKTRYGWHVILVEDHREQQPPGLEAVRAELVTEVERQKLEGFLGSLRSSAEVVVE